MKTLKLLGAALAAVTMTFTAQAVTTNRVTVTSTAGTTSVAGSLAYYVKNAPTNGNVLEITVPHDMVCLLDEPLEITSEQSIVIRSEINPTLKPPFSLLPGGGTIAFTHTLYATKKYAFDVQGFLRLEQMSIGEDDSVAEHGDLRDASAFWVSGKLEFWRSQMGLGKAARYGRGAGVFLAYSRALFENSLLYVGSDYRTTQHASDAEGTLLYSSGGSMTMANCICASASSKCAFYFTGSNAQSLFVNCNLGGGRNDVKGCTIRYSSVAEGKHWIVGSRLGYNEQYEKPGHWEERVNPTTGLTYSEYVYEDEWIVDKTYTRYQVECEGSGRPVIRASLVESGKPTDDYANVNPANGNCEIVNCTVADWGADAIGIELYTWFAGYWKPYFYGLYRGNGREVEASWVENLSPYPTTVIFGQGAWIWHDKDWNNVVGEDTERFTIRGDAEAAVIPLDADLFGKPISVEDRPTPSALQWDEPTLVVNEQGWIPFWAPFRFRPRPQSAEALAERPWPKEYTLDNLRYYNSALFFMGVTSLDDAIAYAREDWRGERKLLGSDGYYHITFADNLKGATIDIWNVTGIDEGLKIVIEGNGETLDAHGASGIFLVEGGELVLKNLTLKGARADGPFGESVARPTSPLAGAIKIIEDGFMHELVGFSDEYTRRGAAVQVIEDSTSGRPGIVTIENCRIEDCLAKAGGAIYLENNGCALTVRNSSFVRCGLVNPASGKGGAIAAAGESGLNGKLTLQDVVFAECGGGETFNDVINLGAAFKADMTGVVMSGGAHGGIYVANGAALTLDNSVIAGNGGYDFAGTLGSVQGSNVYYGSRMAEFWEADFTQVNDPSTVIGSTVREKTVRGVQQAYYDLQVNLPPAPPVTCTVTFASNGGTAVAAQTVAPGGLATRPSDPTALGYVFDGWYVDKDFKKAYDFATAVNFDLTLYAKWNQLTAKVVVEDGGATLRFVFDASNYGDKGTDWFSVAEAETIDPVSGFMPWSGCASSVTKVIFDSSFADCRPKHCGGWFWYFSSLASVEGLENLDVSKATSLVRMFMGCSSLTSLDLAGFDTSCVTDMRGMFYDCTSLKRIAVRDKFVTTSVTASDGMFYGCTALVGGAGTAYVSAKTDREYARIDGEGGQPGYFTRGVAKIATGAYASLDLVKDLGIVIPEDVDYAAGDKVTIKVEGLAKGLKVVTTPVYEDPKAKKKVIVDYIYTIEGVPTEAIDFEKQPMYARVTVTYKDKTKTADKTGKVELLQPVPLSIKPAQVRTLKAGLLNGVYTPTDIAALWPAVADAKVNPKEWSFKGWPAGIKYNATAKDASWSYKDGKATVKATAAPYTVYGQPTKAGEYPITATWKHKLADGKTTVSETFSAVLTVWGDDGASDFRYTDQAYVATAMKTLSGVTAVSGLPAGIKFDKATASLSGTPTKAGVFAVTATKSDKTKETFLWKVAPAAAPGFALDTGTAPIAETKAQIVQGASQAFAIAASEGAKVTAAGLPGGLKLVQDKTTKAYSVEGVATKPGEYVVTFKTVLNGVTTTSVVAFTVKGNPFEGTYYSYSVARPADGAAYRLAVAEVTVAAAGTVKLTYTEGKTKYTANVMSFDWNDATGKGTAEGLVLKVSSADKNAGYGDRKATVTFEDRGAYRLAKLASITDANGAGLSYWTPYLYSTVTTTEVPLPASQTYVFRTEDGGPLAAVSVAYDAKKATAAFSGKLYDGTAVKATVPVMRWDDMGTDEDYGFASFQVIAKDGETFVFDCPCEGAGYIYRISEDGEECGAVEATSVSYAYADALFAALVPETGTFSFGWGNDAEVVGASTESFAFEVTTDKNGNPAGVAIYDVEPQEGEKPLATVTAKMGKTTGAISVSFTSKKGDKAKYAVELVWQGEKLFAGHVTRTWKGIVDGKSANLSASGTADVK